MRSVSCRGLLVALTLATAGCVSASSSSGVDAGCPTACGAGLSCQEGRCAPATCQANADCTAPLTCIAGFCADNNCAPPCESAQACLAQVCVPKVVQTCSSDTACPSSEACVGGYCTQSGCTPACGLGQSCLGGVCVPQNNVGCASPYSACNGGAYCANLSSDNSNCGSCGNVCPSGQVCNGTGVCTTTCVAGELLCNGFCIDPSTDEANCGRCDNGCDAGEACSAGSCAVTCGAPYTRCGTTSFYCALLSSEPSNCGGCGATCPNGDICDAGTCIASPAQSGTMGTVSASATAAATGTSGGAATSATAAATGTSGTSSRGTSGATATASSSSGGGYYDAGTCAIAGVYYAPGQLNPLNQCEVCEPQVTPDDWDVPVASATCGAGNGGCTIDAGSYVILVPPGSYGYWDGQSQNPLNACEFCNPAVSTSAWTARPDGDVCAAYSNGVCQSGVCQCAVSNACIKNNYCYDGSDDANCGGCGITCPPGQLCAEGACVVAAAAPLSPRSDFAGLELNSSSTLVFAGGRSDGGPLADSASLLGPTNAWTMEGSLPSARFGLAMVQVVNGNVYAVGGTLPDGGLTAESDALPGSLLTNWTRTSASLPVAITGAAGGQMYLDESLVAIFGGTTARGATSEVEVSDGGIDWGAGLPALPQACTGAMAVAQFTDQGMVLCGVDGNGNPSPNLYQWALDDSVTQLWDWPHPRAGASASSDMLNQMYVAGGVYPDGGYAAEFDIYDSWTNRWSLGPPLPTPRTGMCCIYEEETNRIYCVGGYNASGFSNQVQAYLISTGVWVSSN